MIANLQFWYRYCTGISFCVVSLKLIYCIINGVPRDFNAAAPQQVTCCLCGSAISVPTVTKWVRGGSRGGAWVTFFNNAFDEYNFSIISILFDNNNSYALYRYTEIENVRKNCIIPYLVKTSKLRAKNSNRLPFALKLVQEALKWPS